MIAEQRSLIFTPDDIAEAVLAFSRERRDFLPDGEVVAIEVEGDAPELCIRVQVPDRIFQSTVRLTTGQLAALMIHFCIGRRIPIPRKGRKELRHVAGGIRLDIAIERQAAPRPADQPPVATRQGVAGAA
ncbi:MAG: hypothetical protein ACFCVH_15025 [Alphaproteobacteria bacterium]